MELYGLHGKSGTGKSHKSTEVVERFQIDAVIDDGILIMNKIIVAGKSAKNERSMFTATKRAIFFDDDHRDEVALRLQQVPIKRLLLIGTSQKMIRRIADRLRLQGPIEWVPIEDFQSEQEVVLAQQRREKGYHVIPILPVEVRKTYSGWFRRLVIAIGKKQSEVTLVKPQYLAGSIIISPAFFRDLIHIEAESDMRIHSIGVQDNKVTVVLSLPLHYDIDRLQKWQAQCVHSIEQSIGSPYEVEIQWRSVVSINRRPRKS